jgi:hypothetical protein
MIYGFLRGLLHPIPEHRRHEGLAQGIRQPPTGPKHLLGNRCQSALGHFYKN